jgi:hypothetical protein
MVRKILLSAAVIGGLFAAGSFTGGAQAMAIKSDTAIDRAAGGSQVDNVAYVCRRYWNGFRSVRSCGWRPGYAYGYSRPYRYRHYSWRRW